jgi:hypothetical protein
MHGNDLLESWGDYVDTTEFLRDWPAAYQTNFSATGIGLSSQIYDRDDGRYRPIYDCEMDLSILRAQAWLLVERVPMAQAWVNRLLDYTVGNGFDWSVSHDDKRLGNAIKSIIDKTLLDNGWASDLERESYVREIVDGEFLAEVKINQGSIEIATRESSELTEPAFTRQLEDYYELDGPVSWTFGIATPRHNTAKAFGYHLVRDQAGSDWDYIESSRFCHWKRNVRRNAKRGVGDFYRPNLYLTRSDKLSTNVAKSAAVQAAIAYIVEHAPLTTATQAASMTSARNLTNGLANPTTGQPIKTIKQDVSRLDVFNGQKYHSGPMGANNAPVYIEVMESLLRLAGTVHAFPEGMLTGSYQNNNRASAEIAATPWKQGRIAEQIERANKIRGLFLKFVHVAAEAGAFRKIGYDSLDAISPGLTLDIIPSKVFEQDRKAQAEALAIEKANGWLDDQTAITELGRDAAVVLENIRKQTSGVQTDIADRVFGESTVFRTQLTDEKRVTESISPAQRLILESWKNYP